MYKSALSLVLLFACIVTLQAQPKIWDINSIDKAKANNKEAVNLIVREADKNLTASIATVMDKSMTPASGDKHDYMSMGRYWWPNPETKDGLPYIRRDGVTNPEINKLDRSPLGKFSRNVYILSLAYYFTNDEKYAAKAVENIRIWFINKDSKMNPNMNFGQTIPGHNDGKGRAEGVLDSYSFVEMLEGVELLNKSKRFSKLDKETLKDWFSTYLNWMISSEIGQEENAAKNNHGTAFDVQLTRYALFTGDVELAKKTIADFPEKRLFKQIEPNGAQTLELARTTALGYSVYNLTHFIDICQMAKTLDIDLFSATSSDGRSITKAIDFLVPFIGTKQTDFPYKQIKDWEKVQKELCWQLLRADKLSSTPRYTKHYSNLIKLKENNLILY